MKARMVSLFILASLLFAACSPSGTPAPEATPIPTVIADEALIAEGRVEPVRRQPGSRDLSLGDQLGRPGQGDIGEPVG